jgi:5-methylcytosine-specific restriction enzyme A
MPRLRKIIKNYKRLRESSKKDNLNHKVYNTNTWRKLRLEYLKANPLCSECLKKGKLSSACEAHHIVPISTGKGLIEKMEIGYDYLNLKGLCNDCHKMEHQKLRNISKN